MDKDLTEQQLPFDEVEHMLFAACIETLALATVAKQYGIRDAVQKYMFWYQKTTNDSMMMNIRIQEKHDGE